MTSEEEPAAGATRSGGTKRPDRVRRLLVIVAAFVLVLGAVAGGAFYYFYDRATAIDRSHPETVVIQFLDATLRLRDPARTSLFICSGWSVAAATAKVDPPSDERVSASWGAFTTQITGNTARVSARVSFSISVGGGVQDDPEDWTFRLENQDGWRVCDVTKETSLDP